MELRDERSRGRKVILISEVEESVSRSLWIASRAFSSDRQAMYTLAPFRREVKHSS
jgi:hypothetical protein